MTLDLRKRAKDIIQANQYMTLASVSNKGLPWASAVCYAYDTSYNFYWVSMPDSNHQKNIKENSTVSATIFDSHQDWGAGIGIQLVAEVTEVTPKEYSVAFAVYFSRKYPYGKVTKAFSEGLKQLLKGKTYRFYKATPKHIWVPDPESDFDIRVEVHLANPSSHLA